MDISELASGLTNYLSPYLPYLSAAGSVAGSEIIKRSTAEAWKKAKTIWKQLGPKIAADSATVEAVKDVVKNPDDRDDQTILSLRIKKLLERDDRLARKLNRLLQDRIVQSVLADRGGRASGVEQDATGKGSVRQSVKAARHRLCC